MRRQTLLLLLAFALVRAVSAGYTVDPGYLNPPSGLPITPREISFLELPLWILLIELCTLPLEAFTGFWTWISLRCRRLNREELLDNSVRSDIFDSIRKMPGIHLRALSAATDTPMSTLRYHLGVLQENHTITTLNDGGHLHFYENSGTYTAAQQTVLRHLRNETTRAILGELLRGHASSRQEIADAVGVSAPAVSWHMKRLVEDHIVQQEKTGRTVNYEIRDDVAADITAWLGKKET
ncbi:winged helix-turn-helix transcriptional regulator [Methanofollis ethanolicus]|uniref:winged helix-turn-helix transcriptional regulator n=1 Tax=Methanofollis ethanolicus TaxID=488124 RepID=UPI00083498BD|nr:helix-turn-helix domain-containing protein [Methanofollis ethanolicus]